MEILYPESVINEDYTEDAIGFFTRDVRTQLVAAMWEKLYTSRLPGVILDPALVQCSGYWVIQMNTARQVLTILTVVVSDYDSGDLVGKGIVHLPKDIPLLRWISHSNGWDLLNEFALDGKQYYLFLAYNLLVQKLWERDTHLFRLLFTLVCLELWRQNIPWDIVAWPVGKWVHWGDVIWEMTDQISDRFRSEFADNGYPIFANALSGWVEWISSKEALLNKITHSSVHPSDRYFSFLMEWPDSRQ